MRSCLNLTRQKGVVTLMTIMFVPILFVISIGVYGLQSYWLAHQEAQVCASSAALAGASVLESASSNQAISIANTVGNTNQVQGKTAQLTITPGIVTGNNHSNFSFTATNLNASPAPNALLVKAALDYDFIGINLKHVSVSAIARHTPNKRASYLIH